MIVALSRGGVLEDPAFVQAAEHAETYLTWIFGFIGIAPEFIRADGIARGRRDAALNGALVRAGELHAA